MPPRLAPMGMAMVRAMRPFPSGGSWRNTGVRNVSIMAAVAVLDTNMEKMPVMRMKPSSTISLRVPNGFMSTRASWASSPVFVAAMARMKPPMKSMMTGSAKVAIMSLYASSPPTGWSASVATMAPVASVPPDAVLAALPAMAPVASRSSPSWAKVATFWKPRKALSEVKSNRSPMMATDVAQAGTTSSIHIRVEKAKMAMTRC